LTFIPNVRSVVRAVWVGEAETYNWHAQRYKPQEGRAAGLLFSLEVCDGHGVRGVWVQQAKPINVMRNKPLPPVLKGGSSRPPDPQRTRNIVARARCRGPCITLRFKEDFAEKEWRNKEDPHCKACIQRLREQGKTHRCARCRVWSARSDLSAKEATTLALLLCKDCKKRSGLRKCSQPSH
jgi:hypothetical protein